MKLVKMFLAVVLAGGLLLADGKAHALVSSPGTVTFSNPAALSTTATFSSSGTFVLQLCASDSTKTTCLPTTVTVLAANIAPNVSIGAANGVIAGNGWGILVSLAAGTVGVSAVQFDMVLPAGISTPTVVAGAAATAAGKTATGNLLAGNVYRVILAGLNTTNIGSGVIANVNVRTDPTLLSGIYPITISGISGSDGSGVGVPMTGTSGSLTVAANQAPALTIGANQTITLPVSATLIGTATDDGAPNPPGAMTYNWTVL